MSSRATSRHIAFAFAVLVLVCCLPFAQAAAGQNGRFVTYGVESGLSQSSVYAVAQDPYGFLWVGTADGLNRFDGYTFTTFRNDPADSASLADHTVRVLLVGAEGHLWIGTDGGLSRYDRTTGGFHNVRATTEGDGLGPVEALAVEPQGRLWVGSGRTLFALGCDGQLARVWRGHHLYALHDDGRGTLWMATDAGLFRAAVQPSGLGAPRTVPGSPGPAYALHRDARGRLWVGTEAGLYRYDRSEARLRPALVAAPSGSPAARPVRTLTSDPLGRLWIGSSGRLLAVVDPATEHAARLTPGTHRSGELPSDLVQHLFTDRSGLVWIGTDGGGLVKVDARPPRFAHVGYDPRGLRDPFVKALYEDRDGALWVGTLSQGLHRRDPATGRWRVYHLGAAAGGRTETVFAVLEDRADTLWVGAGDGLYTLEPTTGRSRRRDLPGAEGAPVTVLLEDRAGTLWVGTRRGLFRRAPDGTLEPAVFGSRPLTAHVLTLYEDRTGTLWIGTRGGLLHAGPEGTLTAYRADASDPARLAHAAVSTLCEDGRGRLWVGTHHGLHLLDPATGRFTRFLAADGLPSSFIYGILRDERGRLWVSTNRGLSRLALDPSGRPTFRNYDTFDGLQSPEFNTGAYFRSPRGELFFGGINGFNHFFPETVDDSRYPPPVALTVLKKFDQPVDLERDPAALREVRLDVGDAVFSFEFAALDFTRPERTRYAYRLDGFDREWVQAGTRREARYTNVPPGRYAFRVRATNSDGVWSEADTAVDVIVPTPFWRTGWFLSILALGGIVVFGGSVRFVSSRALERRLAIAEAQRALEHERMRIAEDMHDHVGASLTQVLLLSELGRGAPTLKQARAHLDRIASTTHAVIGDMDALVWTVKPDNDTLENFAGYLCDQVQTFCETAGLRCRLDVPLAWPEAPRLHPEGRRTAFLTVREGLNNVVRHADATTVLFAVRPLSEAVEVELADDGRGFEHAPQAPFQDGLANMRRRAEAVGGRFRLVTAPGRGTRLVLELPVADDEATA